MSTGKHENGGLVGVDDRGQFFVRYMEDGQRFPDFAAQPLRGLSFVAAPYGEHVEGSHTAHEFGVVVLHRDLGPQALTAVRDLVRKQSSVKPQVFREALAQVCDQTGVKLEDDGSSGRRYVVRGPRHTFCNG